MFKKYVAGGMLGDLLHCMYVVKNVFQATGEKGAVFITGDPKYGGDKFSMDVQNTFAELKPILLQQEYIESVHILDDTNAHTVLDGAVNLNAWRRHQRRGDWLQHLNAVYGVPRNPEPWIKYTASNDFTNKCVLHHSKNKNRLNPTFSWQPILEKQKDIVFITCDYSEYEAFSCKHLLPCKLMNNLEDMLAAIASAKHFYGNQSSPAAMAVALGKPCTLSLYPADAMSYMQRDWCNGQCYWYVTPTLHWGVAPPHDAEREEGDKKIPGIVPLRVAKKKTLLL